MVSPLPFPDWVPWWVHVVIWVPLTVGLTLALLRVAKGILLALEYKNDARLGRTE